MAQQEALVFFEIRYQLYIGNEENKTNNKINKDLMRIPKTRESTSSCLLDLVFSFFSFFLWRARLCVCVVWKIIKDILPLKDVKWTREMASLQRSRGEEKSSDI